MATRTGCWVTRCPSCNDVVRHNHKCTGAPFDPPTPFDREQFDRWVEEAKAEARGMAATDAQTIEPLTLPIEETP